MRQTMVNQARLKSDRVCCKPIRSCCTYYWTCMTIFIPPVTLILVVMTEMLYTHLFDQSMGLIKYQTDSNQKPAEWWQIVTKFGFGAFDILAILLLLGCKARRPRVIYYGVILSAKWMISNSFKMFYRAPRPFWKEAHLSRDEVECAATYGNPSG